MSKRLLFVVNADWFFLSHRLPLALAAKASGYEVHVAVGITNGADEIRSHGLILHELNLKRSNVNFVSEFASLIELINIFRQVNPNIVHLVTIKPVLYGGIAAKLMRVHAVVAAISGLGYVFVAKGILAAMRRWVVGILYRLATSHERLVVIFQNRTDRENLMRLTGLDDRKSVIIKGSGVDLKTYCFLPIPEGVPCIVMACRLIADKGVWQFIEAARILKRRGVSARFCLVGSIDPDNPTSLSVTDLRNLENEGVVEFWGYRPDMISVMHQATIVTLPSFYGEGLPKVLIEASACGRAIVTTDVPGCRDAIIPDETGLLVPPRDVTALANAIEHLTLDTELRQRMGRAGRQLAEERYDIRQVVRTHMNIYQELLDNP